ncbi:MAG: translation elongation factor Ts, partial [Deltaproteobacteria bacterium]|nr:translation elongation factor Ts [Deltaproteobacteria bacterium]
MEITSKLVKQLRDKTNAGMMDCKKALQECGGDIDKAVDWLRQKGLMTARKRAGRATREGLVLTAQSPDGKKAAIVELNTETDFVAKMDSFKNITESIADFLINCSSPPADVEACLAGVCPKCGKTFGEIIQSAVGTTGENMKLRRFKLIAAKDDGLVHAYVHAGGRLAVLVNLTVGKPGEEADLLAHNIAMHVAAANPAAVQIKDLPQAVVDKEKAIFEVKAEAEAEEKVQKARKNNVPENKLPKKDMIKGKMI